MIDLAKYLSAANMIRPASRSHDDILRELLRVCLSETPDPEKEKTIEKLLHSDAMKDQRIGDWFAITHARCDGRPDIRVALGFLDPPRPFRRGEPVHTVLCAVIPPDKSREYLGFMARIIRLWSDPVAVRAFRAGDVAKILSLVSNLPA